MQWKTFFAVAGALMASSALYLVAANRAEHGIEQAGHGSFVETTFNPDGSIYSQTFITETWRRDGSRVTDSYTPQPSSGEVVRQTEIIDLARNRGATAFHDLGVKIVVPIPPEAEHQYHRRFEDCAVALDANTAMGTPLNGDKLTRVQREGENEVVRRFYPEVGCWPLEYTNTAADGHIVSSRRILGEIKDGHLEDLFTADDGLLPVTRVGLMEARAAHGMPAATGEALDQMRVLDLQKPFRVEEE